MHGGCDHVTDEKTELREEWSRINSEAPHASDLSREVDRAACVVHYVGVLML